MKNNEELFKMFSNAAMKPKKYNKNKKLPKTVTTEPSPHVMAVLTAVAARIGSTRAQVIAHILELGAYEAALGCGFEFEDDGVTITKDSLKWDTTPRQMGFSFTGGDE